MVSGRLRPSALLRSRSNYFAGQRGLVLLGAAVDVEKAVLLELRDLPNVD